MKKILVACHDAGGAEVVSSWLAHTPAISPVFLVEGPAEKIFRRKFPTAVFVFLPDIEKAISQFEFILTGTSWASTLEKSIIALAKKHQIRVAAFLDHWTDYKARFSVDGNCLLPDEIWVGDSNAYSIAQDCFPDTEIVQKPNYYFEEIAGKIAEFDSRQREPNRDAIRILYVCEPISAVAKKKFGNERAYGYTEFDALEGFLRYIQTGSVNIEKIRVRAHPSEPKDKYVALIQKFHPTVKIENSEWDVATDCAWADWIVGCDSMVMALGVNAKKKVFCAIPPGGLEPALPHKEIIRLFPR